MDIEKLLELAEKVSGIALKASQSIMEIYTRTKIELEKKEDGSPVTEADLISHKILVEGLNSLDSKFQVLSEEGNSKFKLDEETFWLIDPLDGTKEFIKRNGEFTVNIALIENQRAVFGVIYVPVSRELYIGDVSAEQSVKIVLDEEHRLPENFLEIAETLKPVNADASSIQVVGSRSHMNQDTLDFIETLKKDHADIEIVSKGSSLKFCLVAEGLAHVYPRYAPTMEWDTAAGQAICEAVGLEVIARETGQPLLYNREDMLNGHFLVKHS